MTLHKTFIDGKLKLNTLVQEYRSHVRLKYKKRMKGGQGVTGKRKNSGRQKDCLCQNYHLFSPSPCLSSAALLQHLRASIHSIPQFTGRYCPACDHSAESSLESKLGERAHRIQHLSPNLSGQYLCRLMSCLSQLCGVSLWDCVLRALIWNVLCLLSVSYVL